MCFVSKLDIAKERISELEHILIETEKLKNTHKNWKRKKQEHNRIAKNTGTTTKSIIYT